MTKKEETKNVNEEITQATKVGQMVKAAISGKPQDFEDFYKELMTAKIDKDVESLKAMQKKQMFKMKPEPIDAEDVLNLKEPTKNQEPAIEDPTGTVTVSDLAKAEQEILAKYYSGMSDAIENMRQPKSDDELQVSKTKMDIEK